MQISKFNALQLSTFFRLAFFPSTVVDGRSVKQQKEKRLRFSSDSDSKFLVIRSELNHFLGDVMVVEAAEQPTTSEKLPDDTWPRKFFSQYFLVNLVFSHRNA